MLSSVLGVNPGYCHTDPCADARGSLCAGLRPCKRVAAPSSWSVWDG